MQKKKPVLRRVLDDPFVKPEWPGLTDELAVETIDLLDALLAPLGRYYAQRKGPPPELAQYFTIGFNQTVKEVEAAAKARHSGAEVSESLNCVFICRSDMGAAVAANHVLLGCSAARIRLISLPKGSMSRIQRATGVAAPVIGLRSGPSPQLRRLYDIASSCALPQVAWMDQNFDLQPTNVQTFKG